MPLMASKLAMPRAPTRVVPRPRLFRLLDAGVEGPVTVVAAPAGAGKTVLLGSWISSGALPGPVAWLTLDRADNDPATFWTYVLAALRQSGAVPAGSVLQTLMPQPEADGALLPLLVNGLQELPTPVVLVLDDVHELTDATVLAGIAFLLQNAPPQLRLVIAARADPPLPLHRLLVGGQLTQIRTADLAFTVGEVAELLDEYDSRSSLSDDDLAALQARTEGWAAGLRLAALSLRSQPDPQRFIAELAGDDRSIADYLVGEVLDRLPQELRRFVVQTCVVDELSGELADAITGRDDGERTLARLERANVFLVTLGSRRDWYRYHPLFAELLRYELRREAPREIGELHRRAARWYAMHGRVVDGIQQSVAAEDWCLAADLVAEHGLRLCLRGQSAVFRELLGQLPPQAVRTEPELALLAAAEEITHHDGDDAYALLRLAQQQERLISDDRRPRLAVALRVCWLVRSRQVGDLDAMLATAQELESWRNRVSAGVPASTAEIDAMAVVLSHLADAELWTGDLDAAETHLREGHAVALQAGLEYQRLDCLSQLAVLHALRGRLKQAAQTGLAAVELAEQRGWSSSVRVAGAYFALAWVHEHRDDLPTASRYRDRAAEASGAAAERPLAVGIGIVQARVRHARGDPVGSFASLEAAHPQDLGDWKPSRFLAGWLASTKAELRIAAGDTESARVLLKDLDDGEPPAAWETIALARLQLAEGDPAGAARYLSPFLDGAVPAADPGALADAWLLDALASEALHDSNRAVASLGRAIELAEQEGLCRTFLDAGAPGRALLVRHRNRIASDWPFLDELVGGAIEPSLAVASPMPVVVEALSERERMVLRYLPSMLTYNEIANQLYVSINTIKSHANNIYRKLGVVSRRDAVRRARELELLRS
jgi:LuxR family transcriptional regulator, maltose regulon positive regulatory protein